jgi:hypothetical protein
MISRSQMNRQLYADGTDDRGIMSQVRDLIQGIVPKSKYMLPLSKLEQIADAQGVSIEEANNMVIRWAMGTSDPKGLEKLFIPKMRRESQDILRKFNEFDPRQARQIQQAVGESQDVPEYYDPRLQILDPEQMREEMQNPSMPMRDMRMGGGIMNVARENYGLGSSIKKFVRKVIPNEVAEIATIAAPFVAPFNPALAATMAGLGSFDKTGRIGSSLKSAALTYGGGQLARGIGGAELQGNPFGGGAIFTSPTTGNPITMDSVKNIFSPTNVGFDDFATEGVFNTATSGKPSVVNQAFNFLRGSAKSVSDVLNSISSDNMKNIIEAGKLGFALYSSNLAKKDQERINENLERVQREYEAKVAAKKSEYEVGTPMTVTRGEVNPVRAPAAYGGRMGFAYGSIDEGIMASPQIANMMGMPVGNPRQNQQGVAELDYRDQGGFVPPIGIKEKADDIPAMLSNNEFVFTANAVKNADPSGNRDPEEGAKVMYRTMKMLENGGMV